MLNKKAKENEQQKPRVHKLCPDHKKTYLLVPEGHPAYTGLCGHPDCIAKNIIALCERNKFWKSKIRLFWHLEIWDDFVSYITEMLLYEATMGKPTIINWKWFNFKILRFLHQELRKGVAVLRKVPEYYKPKNAGFIDQWENDVIEREYEKWQEHNELSAPEYRTFSAEVNEWIEEGWGKPWVLYLNSQITREDMAKLYRLPITTIRKKEKQIFRELVGEFADEDKKDLFYDCIGPEDEPLKKIQTPRYNRRNLATKTNWKTFADKLNEEKGFPVKGKENGSDKHEDKKTTKKSKRLNQ